MNYTTMPREFGEKLATLYKKMQSAYEVAATALQFSCDDCPDNCCDSYFLHHTYVEWCYLWEGLLQLPDDELATIETRASRAIRDREVFLLQGLRPVIMCPVNEAGRCTLYGHRLMICRMHGVPSSVTRPDGQRQDFPGCHHCQELTAGRGQVVPTATVDRTAFYRDLAALEAALLSHTGRPQPKIRLTIADMIVKGPPAIATTP